MVFLKCTKFVSKRHWRLECTDGAPDATFSFEDVQSTNIYISIYSITLLLTIPFAKKTLQSLYGFKTDRYRIPVYIAVLLFNVFIQTGSVVSVGMLAANMPCSSEWCVRLFITYSTTDLCGLYLHQLVALESVLFLRNPRYTAGGLYLPRSVILVAVLYFLAFVCIDTQMFLDFFFCLPPIGILITTLIFTCKAPPPPYNDPDTHRVPAFLVLIVATVTLIVAYLPSLVTMCLVKLENYEDRELLLHANKITFSIRIVRVLCDTILGTLICRSILPVHCEKKGLC